MYQFEFGFVDMDGTIVDFVTDCMKVHDLKFDPTTYPVGTSVETLIGKSKEEFWAAMTQDAYFWENLKPYPWMNELMSAMRWACKNVLILSSPTKCHPFCRDGKQKWLTRYGIHEEMINAKSKHLLAASGRLLVDDDDEKTASFRAMGGKAILFPRLWNQAHALANAPMFHMGRELHMLIQAEDKLAEERLAHV